MEKRQKTTNEGEINKDRLSELPSPLLDHILSYLPMDDVIKTCVLAKSWKNIWRTVPCLNFPYSDKQIVKAVSSISYSLTVPERLKIQKLDISIRCPADYSSFVTWLIMSASDRNVEELLLEIRGNHGEFHASQVFRVITCLTLKKCRLRMPSTYQLSSLRILKLQDVLITDKDLNKLVSASPVLQDLCLTNCYQSASVSNFNIVNPSVKTLKIYEKYRHTKLMVNAPNIICLEFVAKYWQRYAINGMVSLETASFDCAKEPHLKDCPEAAIGHILKSTCHVQDLRLNACFIQAFSMGGEKSVGSLSFGTKKLVLRSRLTERELLGIAYILRHSPNIETLIITVENLPESKPNGVSNCEDLGYRILQEREGFDSVIQNLKTVKVYDFMKNINLNQKRFRSTSNDELVQNLQKDLEFLRFLLEKSKVLERMIIKTCNINLNCCKLISKNLNLLNMLRKQFQGYSRASRVAEVKLD